MLTKGEKAKIYRSKQKLIYIYENIFLKLTSDPKKFTLALYNVHRTPLTHFIAS